MGFLISYVLFENSIELLHKQRGLTKDLIIVRKQRKPRDWETERFQESIFLLWFKRPLFHRWHQLKERLSQTRAACAGWQMAFYFNLRKRNPNQSDQHNWSDSERAEPARTLLESNIFYWYCLNTRGDMRVQSSEFVDLWYWKLGWQENRFIWCNILWMPQIYM